MLQHVIENHLHLAHQHAVIHGDCKMSLIFIENNFIAGKWQCFFNFHFFSKHDCKKIIDVSKEGKYKTRATMQIENYFTFFFNCNMHLLSTIGACSLNSTIYYCVFVFRVTAGAQLCETMSSIVEFDRHVF